jgi:iron complex outermembrane receptor protein
VGQRFGDNKELGIRFNGVYRNGDTPILHNSRETRLTTLGVDYRGENIRLSLDVGYQYQYMRGVRESINVISGVPIPRPPRNTANWGQPWQSYKSEHKYVTTRGEWDINENVTAYAAVGRSTIGTRTIENYQSVTDAAGTLMPAWDPYGGVDYTQTVTAEAGLRGRAETGPVSHALAFATGWTNEEWGYNPGNAVSALPASNLYNPVLYPQPDFGQPGDPRNVPLGGGNENLGFALADTLSILNERVQLMLGVRHQNVKQVSYTGGSGYDASALSPAAALIVKPWENVSLYANYMQALEAGAIAPTYAANPGEVFAPFKTTQYEVGAKVDFGRIAATLAAFTATRPSYAIDPDTFIFGEVGKTRFRGIELTAFGEATETIRFVGGVTVMDPTLVETPDGINVGNRYGGIPKYRTTLSMEWDTPFIDGFTVGATGQYQSFMYYDDDNTRKVDGWYRFDLNARYTIRQPGWKPIIVRATLRNVLDRSYWATTGYILTLSEPRTFLLSTTFQF